MGVTLEAVMRRLASTLVLYAGLTWAFCAPIAHAQAPAVAGSVTASPIVVTSLAHPNTSVLWGRAEGVVAAPLSDVVHMVEDYAKYYTFLPHFRTSRVLSQRGNAALVYMEAMVAMETIKLWAEVKLGPAKAQGNTRVIEAKMVKGNMNILEARWEITPIDDEHTNVAFQLLIEPKVPLPASVFSNENAKASRKTISALRKTLALMRSKTARQ